MATQESRVVQTTEIPAWLRSYQEDILARAKALSRDPLARPEYQIAPLSPLQREAAAAVAGGVGSYIPMLQAGAETTGLGIGALGEGVGFARQADPMFQQAAQTYGGAFDSYDPQSYQAFMNPYTDEVIDRVEQDIARQGRIQENQMNANAVSRGSFGGSRQAVMERELGRAVQKQQADTAAQLRSQGFQQAFRFRQAEPSQAHQRAKPAGRSLSLPQMSMAEQHYRPLPTVCRFHCPVLSAHSQTNPSPRTPAIRPTRSPLQQGLV